MRRCLLVALAAVLLTASAAQARTVSRTVTLRLHFGAATIRCTGSRFSWIGGFATSESRETSELIYRDGDYFGPTFVDANVTALIHWTPGGRVCVTGFTIHRSLRFWVRAEDALLISPQKARTA